MQAGSNRYRLFTRKGQGTLYSVVTWGIIGHFGNRIPNNGSIHGGAVGHSASRSSLKRGNRANLDAVISHQSVADKAFRGRAVIYSRSGHGSTSASQAGGRGVDGKASRVLGGADDDQGLAGVGGNVGGGRGGQDTGLLIFGGCGLIAIVHAKNHAVAGQREVDSVGGGGVQDAVGIGDVHSDVDQAGAVGGDFCLVLAHEQLRDRARRGNGILAAVSSQGNLRGAIRLKGLSRNRTGLISHIEGGKQAGAIGTADSSANRTIVAGGGIGIVGITCAGSITLTSRSADQGAIAVQLHHRGVGVDHNGSLAGSGHHIIAVPSGNKMQRGFIPVPLAAVQVVGVLLEAGGVHDAEVGAVGICPCAGDRAGANAVPRRRLADVVKAGPDEFTGHIVQGQGCPQGIIGGRAPADGGGIIGGQMIVSV